MFNIKYLRSNSDETKCGIFEKRSSRSTEAQLKKCLYAIIYHFFHQKEKKVDCAAIWPVS